MSLWPLGPLKEAQPQNHRCRLARGPPTPVLIRSRKGVETSGKQEETQHKTTPHKQSREHPSGGRVLCSEPAPARRDSKRINVDFGFTVVQEKRSFRSRFVFRSKGVQYAYYYRHAYMYIIYYILCVCVRLHTHASTAHIVLDESTSKQTTIDESMDDYTCVRACECVCVRACEGVHE